MKKNPEYIRNKEAISGEEIFDLIPHKRNEYYCDLKWSPIFNIFWLTTVKKKYARIKK